MTIAEHSNRPNHSNRMASVNTIGCGWLRATLSHDRSALIIMSLLCMVITLSLTKKFRWQDPTDLWFLGLIGVCWFVSIRSFETGLDRWLLFIPAALILIMVGQWPYSANHHWFFLWIAVPILCRPKLLVSEGFSQYVSILMGIMMLAAAVQKLLGGHYLDGSFLPISPRRVARRKTCLI